MKKSPNQKERRENPKRKKGDKPRKFIIKMEMLQLKI